MKSQKRFIQNQVRLLAVLTGFVLLGVFSSCNGGGGIIPTIVANSIELKVMTYNIKNNGKDSDLPDWKKWDNRKEQIYKNIEMIHPDIFGVQEASYEQILDLRENLPEYRWYGEGRDDGDEKGEFSAIFYLNDRFNPGDRDTFWFSNQTDVPGSIPGSEWGSPTYPRICSWVLFTEEDTEKEFYIYNVHLDHEKSRARMRSVEILGKHIENRAHKTASFVVLGDFNTGPTANPITHLVDYLGYVDTWAEINDDQEDGGTYNGWNWGDVGSKRIDYIFSQPDVLLIDSKVVRWGGSDHYLLFTQLLLPVSP